VPRRPVAGEAGFTLVEVLLTVAILGVGVVVVVGGLMTSIKVSAQGSRSAEGQVAIRAYAESVAGVAYSPCATTYPAPGFAAPAGWTAAPPAVSYWTGSAFSATCGTDSGLQRVRLRLTATDGTTESVSIAKRQP
jgi:prepilin-type N-terminal cleavage/methylation domain-containing protein